MMGYEYRGFVIAIDAEGDYWWILRTIDAPAPITPNPYTHAYRAELHIDEFFRVESFDRYYPQGEKL